MSDGSGERLRLLSEGKNALEMMDKFGFLYCRFDELAEGQVFAIHTSMEKTWKKNGENGDPIGGYNALFCVSPATTVYYVPGTHARDEEKA
jgi:hypothetical protein